MIQGLYYYQHEIPSQILIGYINIVMLISLELHLNTIAAQR